MSKPQRISLGLLVAAAAAAAVCANSDSVVVDTITGVPLVLFLPGAALVMAAGPRSARTSGAERIFWACLGSVGATILGGLLLNLVGGLTRSSWAIYCVGVVALATVITWWHERGAESTVPDRRIHTHVTGLRWGQAALVVGAISLSAGALAVSEYSSSNSNQEHFVQLWLLPKPLSAGAYAHRAEVGVANYEGHQVILDVSVRLGHTDRLNRKQITLKKGQIWTATLSRARLQLMTATVSLASQSSNVLDTATLAVPVR
jgi:uncharacterized membrane protein